MECCGIFRQLQAKRHRQRMLQPARHHRSVTMFARKLRKPFDRALEIRKQHVDSGAQGQHGGGIDHVLAGGAPMHIARGLGVGRGNLGGERLHQGNCEIAGAGRRLSKSGKFDELTLQALAIRSTARSGMTPQAASARASAPSKSSIFCKNVASAQTARIAELDSIGASRGKGRCSCAFSNSVPPCE
jgi:hypothetical protein